MRFVSADVKHPITGEVIIKTSMIDEAGCDKIDAAGTSLKSLFGDDLVQKRVFVPHVMAEIFHRGQMVPCWSKAFGMISIRESLVYPDLEVDEWSLGFRRVELV
ncbi:MAG: hypothetical protein CM15mP31_5000 [Gammaproteobacteria bacterium]|nr:MAG: hypothetical protein CM15mP31_5000 [Gammaproteobacteria bacterium]